METGYDENLNENAFYKTLQTEYEAVFRKSISENWTICVPCTQSLDSYELNERNILTHVLIPTDELPETHFVNLNDQHVTICDKLVRLQSANEFVPILFTEVFYAEDVRYKILCLERPINFNTDIGKSNSRIYSVKSLNECISLLNVESTNRTAVKKLDEIIHQFLFLASRDFFSKTVQEQVAFVRNIYSRCLQIVLADKKINAKMKISRMFAENVRISVESYVLHNTHSIVMKGLISNLTTEIGLFNRALRNLANIQLQDISVANSVLECIPKARTELSHLHMYSTVLGKLGSLKRCINLLTDKSSRKLSVDELLPILVFLVVKSGIPTWIAQLHYVKELNFSHSDHSQGSETSFLATTLEAVLTFIHSGLFFRSVYFDDNWPKLDDENTCKYVCNKSKLFWKTKNSTLLRLFNHIYNGDLKSVQELFEREATEEASTPTELRYCHPLCSCDRCEKLHCSQNLADSVLSTNKANDSGCTPLHVAACYGRTEILDWLLDMGANPDCSDFFGSTPLHCAAMHGYQNAVLLLMYAKAPLDRKDDDGNQPLHLAAVNGHADCVKALLYFAEHAGIGLNVNEENKDGDTALHLTVRYYYKDIIQILLNYNANPSLKNKHGSNAFELTESLSVRQALNEKYVSAVNLLNITVKKITQDEEGLSDKQPSEKEEFGVRPSSAESFKNADKLFISVYKNDIKAMKRLLGFSGRDIIHSQDAKIPKPTYKCHPLCRCKNCIGEVNSEEEEESECGFRKIDALSVNICNSDGFTALHMASKLGNTELIRFLLDAGAKVNARTYKELWTPLHISCISNQKAVAKTLLECNSCKINLTDRAGCTALHYACQSGNARMVELLLKYDPDTSIRNERGKTPCNECEENLTFPIIQMLKSTKTMPVEELLS